MEIVEFHDQIELLWNVLVGGASLIECGKLILSALVTYGSYLEQVVSESNETILRKLVTRMLLDGGVSLMTSKILFS